MLYYNSEDDQNVLKARVAALLTQYQIDQDEIVGRLYAVSGTVMAMIERHYSHLTPRMRKEMVTGKRHELSIEEFEEKVLK